MNSYEFMKKVHKGDTVYINSRSKKHCGKSGIVTAKDSRRAKVKFNDCYEQWFSFYSIDIKPVTAKYITSNPEGFKDTLKIDYEEFSEEGMKVLTVSRKGEALHMFHDDNAEIVYDLLCGTLEDAIKTIREENKGA